MNPLSEVSEELVFQLSLCFGRFKQDLLVSLNVPHLDSPLHSSLLIQILRTDEDEVSLPEHGVDNHNERHQKEEEEGEG